jgi:hypothetical protein
VNVDAAVSVDDPVIVAALGNGADTVVVESPFDELGHHRDDSFEQLDALPSAFMTSRCAADSIAELRSADRRRLRPTGS